MIKQSLLEGDAKSLDDIKNANRVRIHNHSEWRHRNQAESTVDYW